MYVHDLLRERAAFAFPRPGAVARTGAMYIHDLLRERAASAFPRPGAVA